MLIAVSVVGIVHAVDVELFGVQKGQAFVQTNTLAPAPQNTSNFFFTAFARAKAFNTVRGARVPVSREIHGAGSSGLALSSVPSLTVAENPDLV